MEQRVIVTVLVVGLLDLLQARVGRPRGLDGVGHPAGPVGRFGDRHTNAGHIERERHVARPHAHASRFALQLHAPFLPGSVARHAVFDAAPAQSAEKTTSVNVVTPSPVAVGLADRVVVY